MRMLILALVAVVLLGGGGAGAYFFFFANSAEASAGDQAVEEVAHEEEDDHNLHAEFIELDPLLLPIVDNNGISQTVSLVIALEVHEEGDSVSVKNLKPKLTDAYIEDMYGVLNEHAALKGGVLQVSMIKKRLERITDELMGEDVVHNVLLQVVQQRPI